MQAVILAGGRGARMGEITQDKQKCMLEVDGAPILEHILSGLERTFGKRTSVIIATGYKGEHIPEYFGDAYNGMKLIYVHDERPLETRARLLLAKDLIVKPFLFLAGDILTPDLVLEKVANRFGQEQGKKRSKVVGVITGATDHSPAPTHALLSVHEGYLQNITHPPPPTYKEDELREMQRSLFSLDFIQLASASNEKLVSRVIHEVIQTTDNKFGVETHTGEWAQYAEPNHITIYQNLPFLKDKDV